MLDQHSPEQRVVRGGNFNCGLVGNLTFANNVLMTTATASS